MLEPSVSRQALYHWATGLPIKVIDKWMDLEASIK